MHSWFKVLLRYVFAGNNDKEGEVEIALVLPCDCEFMCIYSDYKNKQFKCYCPPNHVLAEDKLHCIGPGKLLFFYLFIVLSPSLGPMPKLFSFKQLITMSKISNDIPIIPEIWFKSFPHHPKLRYMYTYLTNMVDFIIMPII